MHTGSNTCELDDSLSADNIKLPIYQDSITTCLHTYNVLLLAYEHSIFCFLDDYKLTSEGTRLGLHKMIQC